MSDATEPAAPKCVDVVVSRAVLLPWILITCCFALWGFANDITNPMVKAFSKILLMSNFEGSLVQFAFYGGYFAMAFPAALFIKKTSYKTGILVGLGLYATGALLFIPASMMSIFWPFLIAYFILTCGLSFLETGANPYILSMGSEETATRRLNFSQAFNPMGSLLGMFTAQQLIIARLNGATAEERAAMAAEKLQQVTAGDLAIIRTPYVAIGLVIVAFFVLIALVKMPHTQDKTHRLEIRATLRRLFTNPNYIEGVVAQFFYVAAQIMCWTFIIHYGTRLFTANYGMEEQAAEVLSQKYNIAAMILFCTSRFICTFLLKFIKPGALLMALAVGGFTLALGTIFIQGIVGLYCLVGISACMSLMFPTIYGIALAGIGEDAKIGAAGLIMAILGGSVLPPIQGAIIDLGTVNLGFMTMPAVHASFVLPLICFLVIAVYGFRTHKLGEV
ncbi:MAG: L-fucose:H+ symporter permease [Planctomycetes bacterium]|nr:L-fucose:H+ symporter permease [Planctomycetota bacterium]MBL7038650.1 L-fucose:H+ symporter permease [Pirellulaceae bacterium]